LCYNYTFYLFIIYHRTNKVQSLTDDFSTIDGSTQIDESTLYKNNNSHHKLEDDNYKNEIEIDGHNPEEKIKWWIKFSKFTNNESENKVIVCDIKKSKILFGNHQEKRNPQLNL
jgi:hypothetical protein